MKSYRWRSFFLGVVLVLSASPVLSQEKQDSKVVEAARKERDLVWYTSMSLDQSKEVMDIFHKRYPFLNPTVFRTGGSRMLSKVFSEANAGKHLWDVLQGSGDMLAPLMQKDLVAPYLSSERSMFPDDLKDDKGYWTSVYVNAIVVGYNTQLVKKEDVPKTYDDLLDPRWKGRKISIDDDYYELLHGLINAWGKQKAVDYFKKLANQEPVVMGGTTTRVQLVIAGEFPLIIAYANILQNFASKGAPIDWVPLEPAMVTVNSIMLGANARHPNVAKLFIDHVLSKNGQEKLWDFQRIPSREDVEPKPPRLFRGYRRLVMRPERLENYNETIKLYSEILNTR
jgi:iron(III) transport system substrate-binding protein